jgi:hypothetical protein
MRIRSEGPLISGCRPFGRAPEDWALLALLVITGLALVFSEVFWESLPF